MDIMKCIKSIKASKNYSLNQIRRIDDLEAEQRMNGGNWIYIPKSEWKAKVRQQVIQEPVVATDIDEPSQHQETVSERQLKFKKRDKSKA